MRKILTAFLAILALINGGCGLVSILGTDSAGEDVVEAKLDLSARYDRKILIFVEQPGWIKTPLSLRREITEKMNAYMKRYIEDMPAESIISYENLRQTLGSEITMANVDIIELAEKLDAGTVIYVEIVDFNINLLAGGYYTSTMKTLSSVYDVDTAELLWPQNRNESLVSLSVDAEKGIEKTISKLGTANAHCILRNFYDCPKLQYRVIEEQRQYEIDPW